MAADEFKLVIANPTGWSWEAGAVRAAVLSVWPDAEVPQARPGGKFPLIMHVPQAQGGGLMKLQLHQSGQLLTLDYGSPELSAQLIELILRTFPPPEDVEVLLYEWGENPRVTAATTAQDLLAIGP